MQRKQRFHTRSNNFYNGITQKIFNSLAVYSSHLLTLKPAVCQLRGPSFRMTLGCEGLRMSVHNKKVLIIGILFL